MNRLQSELHRLYLPGSAADAEGGASSSALVDPSGAVRALVIELTRPASWEVLAKVWHGVQAELELPAPAIAVSGTDGLQLWFSLAEPVAAARAHAFLERLRARFMPEVEPRRVRLLPAGDASALHPERHARPVPARQEPGENWSAFVAPDLAPVFADTPWLDIPPSEEGQATLLRGLKVITPTAFESAMTQLGPGTPQLHPGVAASVATEASVDGALAQDRRVSAEAGLDPKRFLQQVMNDASVALALRIEAAKALLQHASGHPPQRNGD
ncbi:MAG: hypothetical protein ABI781_18205 [Burkholderiales bacterium]